MPAFNSDNFIREEIIKLKEKYDIKFCIETGTHNGETADELGKIFGMVRTIESNPNYYKDAVKRFNNRKDVICIEGNSSTMLKQILRIIEQPVLFYLDAHWYNYNPLLEELKTIADFEFNKSIIIIHDFKVPGKDFGFDTFPNGEYYEWSRIESSIEKIYGKNKYSYYYNEKTSGANRGVIYITPGGVNL